MQPSSNQDKQKFFNIIKENAFFAKKEKGYNVLEVNLIYPRSGVPVLKSMRILNPNQANKGKGQSLALSLVKKEP